jgi:hypothetical protein
MNDQADLGQKVPGGRFSEFIPGVEHNDEWIALGISDERYRMPCGIAFPRFATAVLLDASSEADRTFVCDVRASAAVGAAGWRVALRNDLGKVWTCSIVAGSVRYGKINRGLERGWTFQAIVPAEAPPETFDLLVKLPDGTTYEEHNTVRVVPNFEKDFYILQVTDQHMAEVEALFPDGRVGDGRKKSASELIEWAVPVLNVINPRFLLATGDNVEFLPNYEWDKSRGICREYKRAMYGCTVPMIATTGNHDAFVENDGQGEAERNPHPQGTLMFEQEFGYRSFSVPMGSFLLFMHDYSCEHVKRWSLEQWRQVWGGGEAKYRLVGQHFHTETHSLEVDDFANNGGYPDLVLVGHAAVTCKTVRTEPYTALITYRGQDSFKSAYFHFRRTADGWATTEPERHGKGANLFPLIYSGDDPFSVIKDRDLSGEDGPNAVDRESITEDRSAWGRPKVEVLYDVANDGTASANVAQIVNRLPLRYFDGRIKFLMRKGDYRVSGGIVLAQYDYDGSVSDGDGDVAIDGGGDGGDGGNVGNGNGGIGGKCSNGDGGEGSVGGKLRTAVLVKVDIQPGQPDQRFESVTTVTITPA